MPDERSFLQAILTNPTDDLPRLVYADWLDEQQTDEANRKAEFLRLTAALVMETNTAKRVTLEQRLMELARHLPTDWLPVVSRLAVENCAAAGNAIRRPLEQIEFEFECPIKWESLTPTSDVGVRHCDACQQKVYYCDTITEARDHARQGRCVVVDVALPRAEGDLIPPLYRMGRMLPNSRAAQEARERFRRTTEVDEVSEERERRKLEKRSRQQRWRQQPKQT